MKLKLTEGNRPEGYDDTPMYNPQSPFKYSFLLWNLNRDCYKMLYYINMQCNVMWFTLYVISVVLVGVFSADSLFKRWEGLVLLFWYATYVLIMMFLKNTRFDGFQPNFDATATVDEWCRAIYNFILLIHALIHLIILIIV